MRRQRLARTEQERENAEKLQEIAEIYRIYESLLVENDAVDFGDLVALAVRLVRDNPDVKKYLARFKRVLVDEFQDVNAASDALLKAIAQAGPDIWVVADQRQSIYRFRGAEPSNVARFTKNFGGKRHALANNYRSFAPIVHSFERFSRTMGSGGIAGSWKPSRGNGGQVTLTVAPTLAAEGEAIRDAIERLRADGVLYADQAILARSHLTLARITAVLEQLGVPLLYLGDLFESGEIRDLLSLIALDAEYGGVGLVRVAALPEYRVPRDDAIAVLRWRERAQAIRTRDNIFCTVGPLPVAPAMRRGKRYLSDAVCPIYRGAYFEQTSTLAAWTCARYSQRICAACDTPRGCRRTISRMKLK
jgi:DNA helicase II / ATP-dependent DNA helicase PcrA